MHASQSRFTLVASMLIVAALSAATGAAGLRSSQSVPTRPMVLGTVRIPRSVKANGQPLPRGTYQVRLAGDPLKPAVGETPGLEQGVEFLQRGTVKGKAVASVVPPEQIHQVVRERAPRPGRVRVDLLEGNDYVRVWFNKGGRDYLIHLAR